MGPEHLFIPRAEIVALEKENGGLKDELLSGLVKNESGKTLDKVKVNPLQFTCFQKGVVEEDSRDLGAIAEALKYYGGTSDDEYIKAIEDQNHEKADEADFVKIRDLSVYTPERMALHSIAVLTRFFVKSRVDEKGLDKKGSGKTYSEYIDEKAQDYVDQVNEIYFRLFGIDRTLDKRFSDNAKSSNQKKRWPNKDVAEERLADLDRDCKKLMKKTYADVEAYIDSNKQNKGNLSPDEIKTIDEAIGKTQAKCTEAKKSPEDAIRIAKEWVKKRVYRDRAYNLVNERMEELFVGEVLGKKGFKKKEYVDTVDRMSFATLGGSATGKSGPNALLAKKIKEGFEPHSKHKWQKDGFELGNVVSIGSEEMRDLLVEEDSMKYGNRLYLDTWGHAERGRIRLETFKYMEKVLKGEVRQDLVSPGTGPIITHDRRSMPARQVDIIKADGAPFVCYYFNVPLEEALKRNLYRGSSTLNKYMAYGKNEEIVEDELKPENFRARFVNALNNINSHRNAPNRLVEMLETRPGENMAILGYSTKVDLQNDKFPFIFMQADLKDKNILIRRLPRFGETLDGQNFTKIKSEYYDRPGPMPVSLNDLAANGEPDRESDNARLVAEEIHKLVDEGDYHVNVMTPIKEKKVGAPNVLFATVVPHKGESLDGKPDMIIRAPWLYKEMKAGGKERYNTFLDALEQECDTIYLDQSERLTHMVLAPAEELSSIAMGRYSNEQLESLKARGMMNILDRRDLSVDTGRS